MSSFRLRAVAVVAVGAAVAVPTAAAAPLRATVTLKPRHPQALAAYAAAVSDPGSPDYHRFLSVAEFMRRFAPTATQRRTVTRELRAHGLVVGAVSPNGLSITVRRPSGEHEDALAASDGVSALGPLVQGVVGTDGTAPSASIVIRTPRRTGDGSDLAPRATATTGAGPQACAAAQSAASTDGGLTPAQIAARYGLANDYAAGDRGRGETIDLYELEPFSAADVAAYQSCMGTNATVETEAVDGGAGAGSGSGEAAADVEDLIGLVPDATIRVYEGPATPLGSYATYSAIVADDAAQVVSTSWGVCEAQLGPVAAAAENVLFEEAAAQGQTVLAASGDSGADDCGQGSPAVDDPASQPWVTGVGGTSAHGSTDAVWDDGFGASGGGVSSLWPAPSWQAALGATMREVPDASADADPATGYAVDYRGAWRIVGGTSLAAPTVAALTALADATPACANRPLGLLAPLLYAHADDIADVTSGSNSFDGVAGFAAAPGYDMASGLGTPTAALGPALCGDSLALVAPAAQTWTLGHAVSLQPGATSARSAAVTWSATGLPAGTSISASTGRITGTPTASGRATITLSALDADGATAAATFTATVVAAPAPTRATAATRHSLHRLRSLHARGASARDHRRLAAARRRRSRRAALARTRVHRGQVARRRRR